MKRLICFAFLLSGYVHAQEAFPAASFLAKMRTAAKQGLIEVYYPRVLDSLNGGFLSTFTFDFKAAGTQDKMIVTQARHVWSTSEAALFYKDAKYIEMARHGYHFLREKMWDKTYGGFYTLVDRKGNPKSTLKEAYGNAFAIFALSAYYRCSGDDSALNLAKATFAWLEKHSHDPRFLGYFQHLQRNGTPVVRPDSAPPGSDLGYKDQNSSIHLLEAFTALYKVWPDTLLKKRLEEMLLLIRDTITTPRGSLQLFFTSSWKPISFTDSSRAFIEKNHHLDHISSGHDVETAYMMMEAAEALGNPNDSITMLIAKKMVDHALVNCWDRKIGGFYDAGYYFKGDRTMTVLKDTKNWWAQAEGLNTLLIFSSLYLNDSMQYQSRFLQLWQYVQQYLIDDRYGDWFEGGLDKEPEKKTALKAHIWKGTYHNFRALKNCIERMEKMQN